MADLELLADAQASLLDPQAMLALDLEAEPAAPLSLQDPGESPRSDPNDAILT